MQSLRQHFERGFPAQTQLNPGTSSRQAMSWPKKGPTRGWI